MNWNAFTNGDFDNAQPETEDERDMIRVATAHLLDLEEYKKFYNTHIHSCPPPEFERDFVLDTRLQTIADIITANNFRSVLDVGCRTGNLLFNLCAHRKVDRAMGLDINSTAIGLCQEYKLKLSLDTLNFSNCIFEEYTDDEKYDCVIMADVLEHCISPEAFLERAHSFSNKLIISCPADNVSGKVDEVKEKVYREHVRLLTINKVYELLKKTHWKILNLLNLSCYFTIDVYLLEEEQ
jgi:2-polyprenyl-3-methyl-5-hydroxy-6-metoxy-1,4-benzoquinol methylase